MFPRAYKSTKPTRVFKVGDGVVHELVEVNNGNLAMSGIKDNKIRIFDFISGKLKQELCGHSDYIMEMITIPSKNLLISYSCDKTINIWDTKRNFILLKSLQRRGMILNVHTINPSIFLVQESQGASFFRPNKVTEIVCLHNGATLRRFDKSSNLGKCIGVLQSTNSMIFSKPVTTTIKFYKMKAKNLVTFAEYSPKYMVSDCYELDKSKIVVTFKDTGMYTVVDYIKGHELYTLCPHNNDILNVCIHQSKHLLNCRGNTGTSFSQLVWQNEDDEPVKIENSDTVKERFEDLTYKNQLIISSGRDRNIVISDAVGMRKLGQITIKNCSNDGFRFTVLRRKDEVWV